MAKGLKFRIISRIFHSCRSKDPSSLPANPIPPSLPRHVSLSDDHPNDFLWEQHDKWHVIAKVNTPTKPRRKIYSSSASDAGDRDDVLPLPPPPRGSKKKKKKKTTCRFRMSTSSADSCGLFSSDNGHHHNVMKQEEEEETETLVSSSRSFSTDSSSSMETPHHGEDQEGSNKKAKSKSKKKKKKGKKKKKRKEVGRVSISWSASPARVSMLMRMVPWRVEGKVRESFAVVKRSEDPYEDFRKSMMDMILEKQIFEDTDLEQLLHCFLSLNSSEHHGVIVQVFAEIWHSLFTSSSPNNNT